jgi:hypothetical protein
MGRLYGDWVILGMFSSKIQLHVRWNLLGIHRPQYYGAFTSLGNRIQLLDLEQQHEMKELVKIKMDRCNEDKESFDDHYPIDKLLEL